MQEVSDFVGAFAGVIVLIQKFEFCQPLVTTKLVFIVTFMLQVYKSGEGVVWEDSALCGLVCTTRSC
jgi:hypothetical protein